MTLPILLALLGSAPTAPTTPGSVTPIARPELAWSFVEAPNVPAAMVFAIPVEIPVRLRNEGTAAWSPANDDFISYHWQNEAGEVVLHDGERSALPGVVAPGEEVSVVAKVAPPRGPGRFTLVWDMVREYVAWFGPPASGPSPTSKVTVDVYAWELVDGGAPSFLWSHGGTVRIRVRNSGTLPWEPGLDRLAYQVFDADGNLVLWEGERTDLAAPVPPGAEVELEANIGPLPLPLKRPYGTFTLHWRPLREHLAWLEPLEGGRHEVLSLRASVSIAAGLLLIALGVLVLRWIRPQALRRAAVGAWLPASALFALAVITSLTLIELAGLDPRRLGTLDLVSGSAVFALPAALAPRRWRPWVAVVGTAIITFLTWADVVHLRYFGTLLSWEVLVGGHQVVDVGNSVRALIQKQDALLLVGWFSATVASLSVLNLSTAAADGQVMSWRRLPRQDLGVALVASILAAPSVVALLTTMNDPRYTELVYSEKSLVEQHGMAQVHLLNTVRSVSEAVARGGTRTEEVDRIRAWYADRSAQRDGGMKEPHRKTARGMNVILLQAEALHSFVVGATVNGHEITPTLNRLRERSLFFSNIYDQTAQGRTADAEYAVLNSNHPLERGAIAFLRPGNHFLALPELLRRSGYRTVSSHPNGSDFWNRATLHPRYGFERLAFKDVLGEGRATGWGLTDPDFLERIVPLAMAEGEPFFLFPITVGSHHPFAEYPEEGKLLPVGDLEGTMLGDYLRSVHAFDHGLARLLESVEKSGLSDRTVIAIYGDHDAGLEPTASLLSLAGGEEWGALTELKLDRVPLIIHVPGMERADFDTPGGHVDIAPTLVHLLGMDAPRAWVGEPLILDEEPYVAHPTGAALSRTHVFIPASGGEHAGGCFRAQDGAALPEDDCTELRLKAHAELLNSRSVVRHDLVADLADADQL